MLNLCCAPLRPVGGELEQVKTQSPANIKHAPCDTTPLHHHHTDTDLRRGRGPRWRRPGPGPCCAGAPSCSGWCGRWGPTWPRARGCPWSGSAAWRCSPASPPRWAPAPRPRACRRSPGSWPWTTSGPWSSPARDTQSPRDQSADSSWQQGPETSWVYSRTSRGCYGVTDTEKLGSLDWCSSHSGWH